MRVDVDKYLFIGKQTDLDSFFQSAQNLGVVEFIQPKKKGGRELSLEAQKISQAIKVLREQPVCDQERKELQEADQIAELVLKLDLEDESLRDKRREVHLEIERIKPFGYFSLEKIQELEEKSHNHFTFYFAKQDLIQEPVDSLVFIKSDHGMDYFIHFGKTKLDVEGLFEMEFDLSLQKLEDELEKINARIKEIQLELKELAKYERFLHDGLLYHFDHHQLKEAKKKATSFMDERLFSVEGWLSDPETIETLLEEHQIFCQKIKIEKDERIPTYLENQGLSRIGEDLVDIYDTPSHEDKDPSSWVFWSFLLFFAIILGDGGYGMLFLILSLTLWLKSNKAKGGLKRFITLSLFLSSACVLWGVLTHSFFGMEVPPDSVLRKYSVLDRLVTEKASYHMHLKDDVFQEWAVKYPAILEVEEPREALLVAQKQNGTFEMMSTFADNIKIEIALLIGVLHIILSLMRYVRRTYSALGWVVFLVGAYLYVPDYLNATSLTHFYFGLDKEFTAVFGYECLIGGIVLALVLALIQDGFSGTLEIMNLIQIFSDVLSYLRLYALGLAGGIVSATVNDMAMSAGAAFGLVILLIGHLINIVLSIMGGVIHGLRLNFLEWYHYSFEGGGKKFDPLRLIDKE